MRPLIGMEKLQRQFVGRAATILPFFEDDDISDILINGVESLFIEKKGLLTQLPNPFCSKENLVEVIERMILPLGKRVDASQPYLDGRLADGSRFHIILPPVALDGPLISIRKKIRSRSVCLDDFGSVEVVEFLKSETLRGANLLIAGGTGTGKTTLLSCLLDLVPPDERINILEETSEIQVKHPHALHLEARPPSPEGIGEVTLRDLVRNSLRMRPDRLILGECRGAEAFDMLHAMNTGHKGSLGTIHANSAQDALRRMESLAMMAGLSMPLRTVKEWIGSSIQGVVFLERKAGIRQVSEIMSIYGLEGDVYRVVPRFRR